MSWQCYFGSFMWLSVYFWTNIYRVDSMCETPSVFGGQRATVRQTDIKDEIILPSQECVGLYNYLSGKDS